MKLRVLFVLSLFLLPLTPVFGTESVLFSVPFVAQAPLGDWKDVRQQEGCEEASMLMAMRWVSGKPLSKEEALKEIIAISEYEQKKYGFFENTSAATTVAWSKEYFNYENIVLSEDVSVDSMKKALDAGKLVVIPTNGQKLGNPNFTAPGPVHHMLVVKGYDEKNQEFITNDPGTRKGEGFRYKYNMLVRAVRDYEDGSKHIKDDSIGEKKMILISKEVVKPKPVKTVPVSVVPVSKEPSPLAWALMAIVSLLL